ncbi:MAG: electron transfer flavoprotein subunit alpha/FixB family protein [Vallitaleaceae bacterium]|nr:electron transfer flavoprotein subunit alpha/FixB family protein [Vallitaleaceae bacterium]
MKKCLIYLDSDQMQNSLDLLEVARQMYPSEPYESYGVVVNASYEKANGLFDHIIQIHDSKVESYDLKAMTKVLACVHEHFKFDGILIPATWSGRMLAPRLAIRLHTGLTADVTEIRHNEGVLELVRPAFSGRLLAGIVNTSDGPVMMSVRQNVFSYDQEKNKETKTIDFPYQSIGEIGIRQVSVTEKVRSYDIRESEVLISGGGGVSNGFKRLHTLADALNGEVAASRRIVDKGIATRHIQVGQSGKTVSPKLYMALGIYGAIQHVEGLKNVDHIISVNTNSNAPICSLSDIVVEGDALTFTDMLVERIRKYKSEIGNKEEK